MSENSNWEAIGKLIQAIDKKQRDVLKKDDKKARQAVMEIEALLHNLLFMLRATELGLSVRIIEKKQGEKKNNGHK
ncbi:MAG: hypothetical protein PHW65_00095 [Dehalococcoidales bacterium]|nr:hypothetical protein [Dehalococcoidales bacterium]